MALTEYPRVEPFPGVIGRTTEESSPAWPASTRVKDDEAELRLHMARQ